jgi:hypothetical protein
VQWEEVRVIDLSVNSVEGKFKYNESFITE